jgi:anti-anti-sigma factor
VLHTPAHPAPPDLRQLLSVTAAPGRRPGQVVVEVTGEVDAYTTPVLELCLHSQARRPGVRELVVDLGQVTFLAAAGVGVLVQAHHLCRARDARLVVRTGGRRCALRPLQLTGLTDLVPVDPADLERDRPRGQRPRRRPRTTPRRSSEGRSRRVSR